MLETAGGDESRVYPLHLREVVGISRHGTDLMLAFLLAGDGRVLEELYTGSGRRFVSLEREEKRRSPETAPRTGSHTTPASAAQGAIAELLRGRGTPATVDPHLTPVVIGHREYLLATTRIAVRVRGGSGDSPVSGGEGGAANASSPGAVAHGDDAELTLGALVRHRTFPLPAGTRSLIRLAALPAVLSALLLLLAYLLWFGVDARVPRRALVLLYLGLCAASVFSVVGEATRRESRRLDERARSTARTLGETVRERFDAELAAHDARLLGITQSLEARMDEVQAEWLPDAPGGKRRCDVLGIDETQRGLVLFVTTTAGQQLCVDTAAADVKLSDRSSRAYYRNTLEAWRRRPLADALYGPHFIVGHQDAKPRFVLARAVCSGSCGPPLAPDLPVAQPLFVFLTYGPGPESYLAQHAAAFGLFPYAALTGPAELEPADRLTGDSRRLLLLQGDRVRFSYPRSFEAVGWRLGTQIDTGGALLAAVQLGLPVTRLDRFDGERAAWALVPAQRGVTVLSAITLGGVQLARRALTSAFAHVGFWLWIAPLAAIVLLAPLGGRERLISALLPERRPAERYLFGLVALAALAVGGVLALAGGDRPGRLDATVLHALLLALGAPLLSFVALVDSPRNGRWMRLLVVSAIACFALQDVVIARFARPASPLALGFTTAGVAIAQLFVLLPLLLAIRLRRGVRSAASEPHRLAAASRRAACVLRRLATRSYRATYCALVGLAVTAGFALPAAMLANAARSELARIQDFGSREPIAWDPELRLDPPSFPACFAAALSVGRAGVECLLPPRSDDGETELLRMRLAAQAAEVDAVAAAGRAGADANLPLIGVALAAWLVCGGLWGGACALAFGWGVARAPKPPRKMLTEADFSRDELAVLRTIQSGGLVPWRDWAVVRRLAAGDRFVVTRDGLRLTRCVRVPPSPQASADGAMPPQGRALVPVVGVIALVGAPFLLWWVFENSTAFTTAATWVATMLAATGSKSLRS